MYGIKSALGVPTVGRGRSRFLVCFPSMPRRKSETWPEALVNRLQLLAQLFVNALARKRTEKALSDSETRLRLAAASANAGLWTLEPASGRIWATEKAKELFGFGPTEEIDLEKFLSLVHPEDRETVRSIIGEGHSVWRRYRPLSTGSFVPMEKCVGSLPVAVVIPESSGSQAD